MANPNGNAQTNPEPEVKGKDLLQRGLDALFGKAGDLIHGATQKGKEKGDEPSSQDEQTPNPAVIEAEGSEVPPKNGEA